MKKRKNVSRCVDGSNLHGARGKLFATVLMLSVVLAGCGKKQIDYNEEASDSDASSMTGEMLGEQLGVPELFTYETTMSDGSNIKVNANIFVPEVRNVKVINAANKEMNAEEKERIIGKLTNQEVYLAYGEYLPKCAYETELENAELSLESVKQYPESWGEMYDEAYASMEEAYENMKEMYDNAPEGWTQITDYSEHNYMFNYNGNDYLFEIISADMGTMNMLTMSPFDAAKQMNKEDKYRHIVGPSMNASGENECSLELDEAQEVASEFVKEIAEGEFVVVDSSPAGWAGMTGELGEYGGEVEDNICDGYFFTFYRQLDGVIVDGTDYSMQTPMVFDEATSTYVTYSRRYSLESIVVCVNDSGVVYFQYKNPYEITETVEDNAVMLSFDKIMEAIKQELNDNPHYDYSNITDSTGDIRYKMITSYNYLDLAYFLLKDSDNSYVLVPVWRLMPSENNTAGAVIVNAIDGSIINVNDELFEDYSSSSESSTM